MACKRGILHTLIVLLLVTRTFSQTDPVENCRPSSSNTFLCEDRATYCTENYEVEAIYDLTSYCSSDQMAFWNPEASCNCKPLCVDVLKEGDSCSKASITSYPDKMCGVGLSCMAASGSQLEHICTRDSTKICTAELVAYETAVDAGTLGPGVRYPECDDLGLYAPRQCSSSSTCYCTDKLGNRLHGEAPFTEKDSMDCKCSRHWQDNSVLGIEKGFRCLSNGNFDSLQCNDLFCTCYNSTNHQITKAPFNIVYLPTAYCYNPEYHSIKYTNPCDVKMEQFLDANPEGSDLILGTSQKPNCSVDGYFAPIQPTGSAYFCSAPDGSQIEDFTFTSTELPFTTCNCATRRYHMKNAGLLDYLPSCCPNGNFRPYQTRGLFSYCVNVNGDQVGESVPSSEAESLQCNDSLPC